MRIDRLKIQNFNGFEACEIQFDPHFNLLVGDNASGKTTVLDALSILFDSWVRGIKGDEVGGGIDPDYIRLAAHKFNAQTSKEVYRFEPQLPVRLEGSGTFYGKQIDWARERTSEGGRTKYVEAKNVSGTARDAARIAREGGLITLPLVCTYGTERLWLETGHRKKRSTIEKKKLPSRLDGYKDCNWFRIQETALLDWIRAEAAASREIGEETTAYAAIQKAIVSCIEGAASFYYDERYGAVIAFASGKRDLFRNLSDGQRIMFTLIGDIVRRAETLNPHLGDQVMEKTDGVVLIDELDLHLHPIWQRRIIHDLKITFPAIQFITTTHSPQLIGEAQPSEIRILAAGKAYSQIDHSFGLDSSRVLEEIQGASRRSPRAEELIHHIAVEIDKDNYEEARKLTLDLEKMVGSDDAEVIRPRSVMKFMEDPL